MSKKVDFSIIIPLYINTDRFYEDLIKFNSLKGVTYEILVVHDTNISPSHRNISKVNNLKILSTNQQKTGPAEKRDFASEKAQGKYLAFIDDDAYPNSEWLKISKEAFERNKDIVSTGGPGITPNEDGFFEQISGKIYESFLCSGLAKNRFIPLKRTIVYDWPAYNLIVDRETYEKVGGFGVKFYGGEDTFLCLKLSKIGNIMYLPDSIVYHHRRPIFVPLLKQIYNIGKHRGYFFKKYPKTSRKLFYIFPSLATLTILVLSIISIYSYDIFKVFVILLLLSLLVASTTIKVKRNQPLNSYILTKVLGGLGIIAVHISYGIAFIQGLITPRMER